MNCSGLRQTSFLLTSLKAVKFTAGVIIVSKSRIYSSTDEMHAAP